MMSRACVHINPNVCICCGACVNACPTGAIIQARCYIITDDCVECGACADECPAAAIYFTC